MSFYCIKNLLTYLKKYLKDCFKCNINKTKRHKSYDRLQLIMSFFISSHTIIMNLVLVVSFVHIDINNVMTVTCQFSKKIIIILDKNTWSISRWAVALLNDFDLAEWKFSKIIISDKNRNFFSKLWTKLFELLSVKLLYSTVYHF